MKFLSIAAMSLLLGACSTISVNQDYDTAIDFASYQSYRWDAAVEELETRTENNNPLVNKRIRAAVNEVLQARGYQLVPGDKSDFIVSYQTTIKQRTVSDDSGGSFSIGIGSGIGSGFGAIGISSGNRITERDEATLAIDFVDANSGELSWRGSSSRYIDEDDEPAEVTETIREHVTAILAQFPPVKEPAK